MSSPPEDELTVALAESGSSVGVPIRSGFAVASDGLRLYWRTVGTGPAIVCCNGIGVSIYFWKYLVAHFAPTNMMVLWDYRSHGRSDREPDTNIQVSGIQRHAADLRSVMDAVGIHQALLVGHSMGCQVLYEFFRGSPDRVLGLVPMLGTAGHALTTFFDYPMLLPVFKAANHTIMRLGNAAHLVVRPLLESPLAWWLVARFGMVDATYTRREDLQTYLSHIATLDLRIFMRDVLLLEQHDAWDVLNQIDVPTLVIAAERDAFTPMRLSRRIVASIPNAELLVLAEGTHASLIEQPDTISHRMDRFIRERRVFEGSADMETAGAFLHAAGRTPTRTGRHTYRIPQPAVVARDYPPSTLDVAALAKELAPKERGYLVHRGALSDEVQDQLDGLRVRGNPVIPLFVPSLVTAIADGTARRALFELEQQYSRQQNLFTARNALTDRRFFFGRADLLTRVGTALAGGEAVLLTGLRKSGKTSLLNILRLHMADHPWCRLDLQEIRPQRDEWPATVFKQIVAAYDRWGRASFPKAWDFSEAAPTSGSELAEALDARRTRSAELGRLERLVLMTDELERLLPHDAPSIVYERFVQGAGALRALLQDPVACPIAWIATDLRPTVNRTNVLHSGDTNPVYQFFQEVALPLFSPVETAEMVQGIARAMGVLNVDPGFSDRLHRFSGGHPAFARLLAGAAYDRRRTAGELGGADLDAGIAELQGLGELDTFFRKTLLEPMADEERDLAIQVAQQGSVTDDPDDAAQMSLRRQGLLARSPTGLRFAIEGFDRWMARHHPSARAA